MPQDFAQFTIARRQIEDEIERLVAILDAMDPDPDLEENGDLEPCCEDEGAQCDDEGEPIDNGIADLDGLHDVYARAASLGARVS